ncbi:MAG: M3 family oligoendopeptidase [Chloroflexi bacterium]|nr:M3 family oligoendopeptidase [Chloroflexota bacterium]
MAEASTKTKHELGPWSLDDLFPGHKSKEAKTAFDNLEANVAAIEKARDQLTAKISEKVFLALIDKIEANNRLASRVAQFASLWYSADTQNQDAQSFQAKIDQLMAGLQNRTLFFSLWWKALDETNAERLMTASGEYAYWLRQIRNFKPYTLTESEEKIINIKDVTGANALQTIYSAITNRYTYKIKIDGEEKELTREELMKQVYSTNPDMRAAAYQELYRIYGEEAPILGQLYQALMRDWHNENVDLRNFASPIAVRNLHNDIPDEVVDTLLEVAEESSSAFQSFFKLKAKLLGMEKLRRYDIYAPVSESKKEYSWQEAVEMTMAAFADFDPKVEQLAWRVLKEDHLDSEVRKGKRGGAFCSSGDPALTPWVLMNYTGGARDISTLAHELGHAVHAMLADDKNSLNYHASLPLAETASTFAEMLLVERLLENEEDESVRRDLLFSQVDNAYATIMRQVFFALFERQAHAMIQEGASVDELSAAYMKNLETQFGDSLEIGEEFKWEWVSIPHIFYYPFYVYAYSFGQLLVFALYQQYKAEGDAFIPRYLELLSAGGSMSPEEILTRAGVDMRDPTFWQGGFDFVAGLVKELEKLAN